MAKYFRLNDRIVASELRVIGSEGEQLGVISKSDAIAKAKEKGLDLVEIAPNVTPPVAKILDFKKFLYDENKKEQASRKKARDVELKELWFTPRIAEHDLQTRLRRVDEFLQDGNKIMIRIKFKGREMGHLDLGRKVLERIMSELGDKVMFEREPKFEGRSLTAILGKAKVAPIKGAPQENDSSQATNSK
jgi:translation initiation factor IF-3